MSQKVTTRKGALSDEKEKRQSPAKDGKKKMASVTEKEKHHVEKSDKSEKHVDKPEKPEKQTDKSEKQIDKKHAEKPEKQSDKSEKQNDKKHAEKPENQTDKSEKQTDKKQADKLENQAEKSAEKNLDKKEKTVEKKETQAEKSKEDGAKEEKSAKNDVQEVRDKPQQNGTAKIHNGIADDGTNGTPNETNGMVSGESDDDDVTLVIDDEPDQDEMFPELAYDDNSDTEGFEPPVTDCAPSRSLTRRSQVKATRTPETPRPASEKQTDKESDADPKDSKVLKLKEDAPPASDRKLRSADSPRPQEGKKSVEQTKKQEKSQETVNESTVKIQENIEVAEKGDSFVSVREQTEGEPVARVIDILHVTKKSEKEVGETTQVEIVDMEVTVEVEADEEKEEPRKLDTNYSKSRVKVSPYRRSGRLADQTSTSIMANYTGNNTTMEMDITETENSSLESERAGSPAEDGSYLRGLRSIRARSSYKKLGHVALSLSGRASSRSARSLPNNSGLESRPTAPVVGRKRRPDGDVAAPQPGDAQPGGGCKRMRLLDRIAHPFRRTLPHSALPASPDIVGINTDLPLTAPVISTDTFDPESLKLLPSTSGAGGAPSPLEPVATPLAPRQHDSKRCAIM